MSALPKPVIESAPAIALLPAPEFDLDATIREVLATSTVAIPRDIAIDVAARIPDEALADVVAGLLPPRIRQVIRKQRYSDRYNAQRRAQSENRAVRAPARGSTHSTQTTDDDAPDTVGSGRWQGAASITHDPKRWRVAIDGEWMLLGDCTADHVKVAILAYRKLAAANEAIADRYCDLRDTMIAEGASKVADLPDDVVRMILTQ